MLPPHEEETLSHIQEGSDAASRSLSLADKMPLSFGLGFVGGVGTKGLPVNEICSLLSAP